MSPRKRKAKAIPKKPISEKTTVELGLALKLGGAAVTGAFFIGGLANSVASQPKYDELNARITNLENSSQAISDPPPIAITDILNNASTGTGNTVPPLQPPPSKQ